MQDKEVKTGIPSINEGRGGSWPKYNTSENTVGGAAPIIKTTRTGVGLGEGYTGAPLIYSNS